MKRAPDNMETIDDDSGNFDVRELRGRKLDADEIELIVRTLQKMRPQVNYSESGNDRLLKWILGMASALVVATIVGGVGFYGVVEALRASVETNQRNTDQRLDRIENRLDGRSGVTRGGADDPHAR